MADPLPSAEEAAKHVTIWNRREHRKIAGNAAPLRRNLVRYLKKHPECEEYTGQDKDPNRAPIDPVTGKHILHLNEHVPIWHTLENRKVTGNAAPLRKNLQAYLRKHPHCEVYNNQDKLPALQHANHAQLWQAQTNNSRSNAHAFRGADVTNSTRAGKGSANSNSASMSSRIRNPFYDEVHTQQSSRPMHAPTRQPHSSSNPPDAYPPPDPPPQGYPTQPQPVPAPSTPSYSEMVSSWSNQPEWTQPYPSATPTSFGNGVLSVGTPKHGALFSSQPYGGSSLDGVENSINGIPIPGGVARDRPDVIMGTSMGASLGTSAHLPGELVNFLGTTPRSMEHDPDIMQFSPSNYLSIGPLSGRSPPMSISRAAPAQKETSMPQP